MDLSNTGTAERWVSFIGVGVLAIVIGYFAPVPRNLRRKLHEKLEILWLAACAGAAAAAERPPISLRMSLA